jgi:hypothetical protein
MKSNNEASNTHPLDELKDYGIYRVALSTGEITVARLEKDSKDIKNSSFSIIGSDDIFFWHEARYATDRDLTILSVSPVLVV